MKIISTGEAEAIAVSCLGFDGEYTDLTTPEALSALIRKTAAFMCPCSSQALQRAVTALLRPIQAKDDLDASVSDAIDSILDYGDLVEADGTDAQNAGPLIYLAPPSFVQISEQLLLIFGIVPDGEDSVPPELRSGISPVMTARRLRVGDATEATDALLQAGYIRLKLEAWLKCPTVQDPSALVSQYDQALLESGPAGTPEDVMIIDPSRPVKFYKGRWAPLKRQTGRFIARRSKAYGAQLWCYIEAVDGNVTHLLDLPHVEKQWNAFDEARHLLQALDAAAGKPQIFRIRRDKRKGTASMDVFSPVPTWASRKWDSVGIKAIPNAALFSYVFSDADIDAECRFAAERMWLKQE
ncbi:MAG TPA: hypothetical protein VJP02_10980 [Candidatus Sulfotelmatobacter sp.]|nr:hypothetical protein [Candidatus Sulfotelmatobacter sp.]